LYYFSKILPRGAVFIDMYAVIDIETTGGFMAGNRIIEVAIFIFDGETIIDQFHSLINPESYIPDNIFRLTGISNEMVEDAPKFYEVAKQIVEITEDMIFVAHNVGFDYGFFKSEFKGLGYTFRRKKLCTVRLSRKVFPGLRSYSLGNICNYLGIQINDRHRAHGDAAATVELLKLIINNDSGNILEDTLKNNSSESTLPPNLPKERYDEVPEETGVYYFHDQAGHVIYVGKAKNIRKRMQSHFSQTSSKSLKMKENLYDITWELTGNELVALLLESHEIKHRYPYYNRSQKRSLRFLVLSMINCLYPALLVYIPIP